MLRYLVVLLGLVPRVLCYSSGAPAGACGSLLPGHGASPQVGESPFTISGPTQAKVDSDIELILHGNGNTFKGFIVRAYEDNVGSTGQFQGSQDVRTLSCDDQNDSASHDSPSDKSKVTITWKAPSYPTNVRFNSTVVINFSTIYMNIATYIEVVPIQDEVCVPPNFVISIGTEYGCPCPYYGAIQESVWIGGQCCQPSACPNSYFTDLHVCGRDGGQTCRDSTDALAFAQQSWIDPSTIAFPYVFSCLGINYEKNNNMCIMKDFVRTWTCTIEDGDVTSCIELGNCQVNSNANTGSIGENAIYCQ